MSCDHTAGLLLLAEVRKGEAALLASKREVNAEPEREGDRLKPATEERRALRRTARSIFDM